MHTNVQSTNSLIVEAKKHFAMSVILGVTVEGDFYITHSKELTKKDLLILCAAMKEAIDENRLVVASTKNTLKLARP